MAENAPNDAHKYEVLILGNLGIGKYMIKNGHYGYFPYFCF